MMKSRNWAASKYFGQTKEVIKAGWDKNGEEASKAGTAMHADIEHFLNQEPILTPDCSEFRYFMAFWQGFQSVNPTYEPYRTEWLVYDEDKKLAGSIDCVLKHKVDGSVVILDWKRSKEIKKSNTFESGFPPFHKLPSCNFYHYTLQLNIYRHLLESKYGQRVAAMYIVVLHPNNATFEIHTIEKYDIASIWDELLQKCWEYIAKNGHPGDNHKLLINV